MLTLVAALRVPPPVRPRPRPWSSQRWCEYFHRQWHALLAIPWRCGAGLSPAQRDVIGPSLQVFQQGEAQHGGHFYRCARAYAERSGDSEYAEAHRLFMAEEKRHGRDLGRFLKLAGVPVLTEQSWLTWAFCWCGRRGGLESTLRVILVCEILALVYYEALWRATASRVLRRLCAQILRDEKQHVRFHCERLAILRRRRWRLRLALSHAVDALLYVAAALTCWCGHRRVFGAGGLGLVGFWRECRRSFAAVVRQKNPRRYALG